MCIFGKLNATSQELPFGVPEIIHGAYAIAASPTEKSQRVDFGRGLVVAFEESRKVDCEIHYRKTCGIPGGELLSEYQRRPKQLQQTRRFQRRIGRVPSRRRPRRFQRRRQRPRFRIPVEIPSSLDSALSHPLLATRASEASYACRKCEAKRSSCALYYIGTYGVCGAAWAVAGSVGSAACNVATLPRTIDCTLNTWQTCYLRDCGMFNIIYWEDLLGFRLKLDRRHRRRRKFAHIKKTSK